MQKDPIVIVAAKRTPIGNFQGSLKTMSSPQLGSVAIQAALAAAQLKPNVIHEVLMGCVLPAGLGQAPARQASIGAGIPVSVGCSTVNKMCGSGMKTVMMAYDSIMAGSHNVVIAGGMESMTNAPYLLPHARAGYRMGHYQVIDHMFYDSLEDAYDKGRLMGTFAEDCAQQYHFTREDQDKFALNSIEKSCHAIKTGSFVDEIAPVTVITKQGTQIIDTDEGPTTVKPEKIPTLRPAFRQNGTVTAANSSSISDGAAALILMRQSDAELQGIKPLATIVGHSQHAQAPNLFTTAPIGAIDKLLTHINWKVTDVDLFEINEAFAVVPMAVIKELQLSPEKVNVNGGACVLGHPIGASGARIIVTLLYALQKQGLKRGVAALCIGGGEATAVAIERM